MSRSVSSTQSKKPEAEGEKNYFSFSLQGVFAMREHFAVSSTLQDFVRTSMEDIENESFNKKLQERGVRFD